MSQFPLDTSSNLVEAVNYLLSGPTSSGQNFEGVSAVSPLTDVFYQTFFKNALLQYTPTSYSRFETNRPSGVDIANWPMISTSAFDTVYNTDVSFSIANIVPVNPGVTNVCTITPTLGTISSADFFVDRFFILSGFAGGPPVGFDGPWKVTSWIEAGGFITTVNMEYQNTTIATFPVYISGGTADSRGLYIEITNIVQSGSYFSVTVETPYYPESSLSYPATLFAGAVAINPTLQPFAVGQYVTVSGVTPSGYNADYTITDVTEVFPSASEYVEYTLTLYNPDLATLAAYTSGGILSWTVGTSSIVANNDGMFTGLEAIVTVTGPTDRVFLSAQLSINPLYYDISAFPLAGSLTANIVRYKSTEKTTLPDGASVTKPQGLFIAYKGYLWFKDDVPLIIEYVFNKTNPTKQDVILNNVIENPGIGYYWYVVSIQPNQYTAGYILSGLRSFTAQVIKQ